jgi:hypothetical protein
VEKKKLAAGSRRRLEEKEKNIIFCKFDIDTRHTTHTHTTHNQQKTHRQDKDTTAGTSKFDIFFWVSFAVKP